MSDALVVFHGFGQGALARLFGRAGYRHCFICFKSQGAWLRLDFLGGRPILELVCADAFDLAAFYREAGLNVVETHRRAAGPPVWPLMLATCVGAAKQILGLRVPFVLTPYQLKRHLEKETHSWAAS